MSSHHTFSNLAAKLFNKDHTHTAEDSHAHPTAHKSEKVDTTDTNSLGMRVDETNTKHTTEKHTSWKQGQLAEVMETDVLLTKKPEVVMTKTSETTILKTTEVPVQKTVMVPVVETVMVPVVEAVKVPVVESTAYTGAPIVHSTTYAPIVKTHVNATVLDQTVRKETVVEIQPVIHRMVEEPEVHVIEKHIFEKVPSAGPHTYTKQTIVEETLKPRIIEEIQPVLHRDVPAPYITHVEQHINEHEVRPTTHTKEVMTENVVLTPEQALARGLVAPVVMPTIKEPLIHSHREAAIVDTHLNATIVEQTTRMEKVTEIQPIIHREIDAPEVHLIEKHMHESVPFTAPHTITKQAIIEESIRPTIVEEIVPIVHREVPEMIIEKREEHITENIVAPTIQSKEVINETRVAEAVALMPNFVAAPAEPIVRARTEKASLTAHKHDMLVEETARPEEVIEVQPIVHREIDAPEVHVIEKHLYETVPSVGPKSITKTAIVEETIVPKVLEEIKPVLHREVPVTVVEQIEDHRQEHITMKTTETKEVFVDGKRVMAASEIEMPLSKMSIKEEEKMLSTATKPTGKAWTSGTRSEKL